MLLTTLLTFLVAHSATAYNILAILPLQSNSHRNVYRVIVKTLLSKGHHVTVITPFAQESRTQNYTHVDISSSVQYSLLDSMNLDTGAPSALNNMNAVYNDEIASCHAALSSDVIQQAVISKTIKFDLIIAEMFYLPCHVALAVHLNVPFIWLNNPPVGSGIDRFVGNPDNPSYIPALSSPVSPQMNFYQRFFNTMVYLQYYINFLIILDRAALQAFSKVYPDNSVTVSDMYKRVDLVFRNTHNVLLPRPNVPSIIEIGGIHIGEEQPLPEDIRDFIEGAKDGVIYFSIGSALRVSSMSKEKLKAFVDVFSKLPQRVLWRSDIQNLTTVPSNVKIGYWFPQRDILAHKNVRVFISHGGLFSTYEAIYGSTPILGIPFRFDQHTNVYTLKNKGVALCLEYSDLTKESLLLSLTSLLNDNSFQKNMDTLSKVLKDWPMSPIDKVIYWTEYVIRYNGAPHLRSAGADLPLYKYLSLDIIFVLILVCSIFIYLLVKILRLLKSCFSYFAPKQKMS